MNELRESSNHILIADDDESSLLITTDLLRGEGYQCTAARNGLEALRALEVNQYDLLIAEIRMPGNKELELVRAAHHYTEGMPVIICTRHPSLHTAIASIELPVTAYLVKPVQFSLLLHHVKTSIAHDHNFKRTRTFREGLNGCRDKSEQNDQLTSAISETINVLQSTRSSFKSKKLATLRRKLERLLADEQSE